MKSIVSTFFVAVILVGTLIVALDVEPVRASGTIYIRATGEIDPPDAPINTADLNTYYFTDNINDSIVVQRNHIIIDGACYTLQGTGAIGSRGINIPYSSIWNVTIRNTNIRDFHVGIRLASSYNTISGNNITANSYLGIDLEGSSYSTISGNNIANSFYGVWLASSNDNSISENTMTSNTGYGIGLSSSSGNSINGNNITNSDFSGIFASSSSYNIVSGNSITANNWDGVWLDYCSNNSFSGNNMTANRRGMLLDHSSRNNVIGNNITDNTNAGITFASSSSNYNIVSGNNITNNSDGIYLSSSGNSISGNNITANDYGIWLRSFNNSISDNTFTDNGLVVWDGYQNTVENNTVNGKPLVYLEGVADRTVDDAGQVILVNCTGIKVENLNISRTDYGIQLLQTRNSRITGNNITNNLYGISLRSSSYNTISGNNITASKSVAGICLYRYSSSNSISGNNITNNVHNGIKLESSSGNSISGNSITANDVDGIDLTDSSSNTISENNINNNDRAITLYESSSNTISENNITDNQYGVALFGPIDNRFYHNNFINNTLQVYIYPSGYASVWDDGYPSGGNYWSNYAGEDMCCGQCQNLPGSDDLGDTPYTINADNRDNYPLMKPWSWAPHDIALMVTLSKNIVGQGYTMHTNIKVTNQGDYTETFNVTAHANTTLLQTFEDTTLASGNSITMTVTWNTTYFAKGNYTMIVAADHVPGEADTVDNTFKYGWIVVTIPGDVNGDKKVDMRDIGIQGRAFGAIPTSPNWDANADINNDYRVDMRDMGIAGRNFDQSW